MVLLTDEEYVAKHGLHCIDKECDGSVKLESNKADIGEDGSALLNCHCDKCGKPWRAVYQLTHYLT